MAKYHQVQDKMYDDLDFLSWSSQVKHIFMVLITNPRARLCGVQENNVDTLHRYSSLPKDEIQEALAFLVGAGKIVISQTTQEIAVVNYIKHNVNESPKQHTAVMREFESVKDKSLLPSITGATKFLPILKQMIKQAIPKRKQPNELSSFEQAQLRKNINAARAELRSASFS